MKLLLFLDIDGVLNTDKTAKEQKNLICSILVSKLNNFLKGKDIAIVISSSWRHDMKELKLQLKKAGFNHWNKVIGKTPSYSHLFHRGEQIRRWIADNPINNAEIIIIDDDVHDITPYFPDSTIVRTDIGVGLTDSNIERMNKVYDSCRGN